MMIAALVSFQGGSLKAKVLYSSRPKVETLAPQAFTANPPLSNWLDTKRAFVAYTAALLAIYQSAHFFFLARDSEYLYDTARVLLENDAETLAKISLLPVSRLNISHSLASQFLIQNGLDASKFKNTNAVLVDLGWRGSIPQNLISILPNSLANKTVTQFVTSSSGNGIPSSRVFLETLLNSKKINISNPAAAHSSIVSVEHLPHYTARTDKLENLNGMLEATSPNHEDTHTSLQIMSDIKEWASRNSIREWFDLLREDMSIIAAASRGETSYDIQEIADRYQRLKENGIELFHHDVKEAYGLYQTQLGIQNNNIQIVFNAASLPGVSARINSKANKDIKPLSINEFENSSLTKGMHLLIDSDEYKVIEPYEKKNDKATKWFVVESINDGKKKLLTIPTIGPKIYIQNGDLEAKKEFDRADQRIKAFKSTSLNGLPTEIGNGYIITELPKSYVSGREWFKSYEKGEANTALDADQLGRFLETLASAGVYFGELTRDNLIFDGSKWHIIYSGSPKFLSKKDALVRYLEKFSDRWSDGLVANMGIQNRKCSSFFTYFMNAKEKGE